MERDIAAVEPRWTGDAAAASFTQARGFVFTSYPVAQEAARTSRQLAALSAAAGATTEKFSNLKDPGFEIRDLKFWDPHNDSVGGEVAAELRATYTVPVQSDASTMPLGQAVSKVPFSMPPPGVGGTEGGTTGVGVGGLGGGSGDTGTESGAGASGVGESGDGTSEDGTVGGIDDGTGAASGEGAAMTGAAGPGTGQQSGGTPTSGIGTGTNGAAGAGDLAGAAPDSSLTDAAQDDPATPGSGFGDQSTVAPLLSPASAVTGGRSGGSVGGGFGGGAGGGLSGGGRSASPLGLRPDAAALRSTATAAPGTGAGGGARPSSGGGYGAPGAGAGQRGQNDGRHRVPGYLIDKKNGEEIVGGLPLVGPGVIGQWKTDGAPEPPAKGGPRPR
ncbi:hypothetical protein [Tsukamurella sp. 1534]|uniref:hypothetical protein n=1 Tax=Tsukamurella sp. 1534 TaxID=1151061 RepID=UPI000688CD6C|nr:hypothetical protein [Tsukamurella sp. 1534]